MRNIRISSNGAALRSGEELFQLKNGLVGYEEPSEEEKQRRWQIRREYAKKNMTPIFTNTPILKSCDVTGGVARIESYERFYTGHDDSEILVELLDEDNKVLWTWSFDDVIGSGARIEADALIRYLEERFQCPVKRSSLY